MDLPPVLVQVANNEIVGTMGLSGVTLDGPWTGTGPPRSVKSLR